MTTSAPLPSPTPTPPASRADAVLYYLPTAIAFGWLLATIHLHGFELPPAQIGGLALVVLALHFGLARWLGPRRMLYILPGRTLVGTSARSAAAVGVMTLLTGTGIEFNMPRGDGPIAPMGVCIALHGLCGFAAAYCLFLRRYRPLPTRAPRG